MNKFRYIVVMLCLLVVGGMSAQEQRPAALGGAPEYVGYTQVYDFVDELADMGIISVNSVVKPYDRNQIAAWLVEAAEADSLLSVRQRKELWFYLNDFALECEGMYDGVVQWSNVGAVVNKELWGDAFSLKSTVNSQQSTVNSQRMSISPTDNTDNTDIIYPSDLDIRSLASQEVARQILTDSYSLRSFFLLTELTELFRQRLKDHWFTDILIALYFSTLSQLSNTSHAI